MASVLELTVRNVSLLWRDRQGRFSGLKAAALAGTVAPGLVLAWRPDRRGEVVGVDGRLRTDTERGESIEDAGQPAPGRRRPAARLAVPAP